MKTLKFKTNINCGGCVAKVTPALNELPGIIKWDVDTTAAQKILTVESSNLNADEVKQALSKAGFKGEEMD
ncbi:MAG: protein containing heavy-metal-associated domain [Cytophagaceae bacterium]|jgi:copper chaperone|nr:protein containing heavy-metal-associated domain [Cytophagaceae bacterium]